MVMVTPGMSAPTPYPGISMPLPALSPRPECMYQPQMRSPANVYPPPYPLSHTTQPFIPTMAPIATDSLLIHPMQNMHNCKLFPIATFRNIERLYGLVLLYVWNLHISKKDRHITLCCYRYQCYQYLKLQLNADKF